MKKITILIFTILSISTYAQKKLNYNKILNNHTWEYKDKYRTERLIFKNGKITEVKHIYNCCIDTLKNLDYYFTNKPSWKFEFNKIKNKNNAKYLVIKMFNSKDLKKSIEKKKKMSKNEIDAYVAELDKELINYEILKISNNEIKLISRIIFKNAYSSSMGHPSEKIFRRINYYSI
jgi:hypothetical protein